MSTPHHEPEPAGTVPAAVTQPPPFGVAYPGDVPPTPPPARPRSVRRSVLAALAAAVAVAVLGAPLGLLWAVVAPGVPVVQAQDGPVLNDPAPEQFIAADGWFSALGLAFGVLAAVGVWWLLRRSRGPVGLVAVTFGAIGAAMLAWWVGRHVGLADYEQWRDTAAVGQAYLRPADLRGGSVDLLWGFLPAVRGDLLVPAFGAVVTYTLLAGWAADSDLGAVPGPAPAPAWDPDHPGAGWPAFSSGSPDQPAPTGAPAPHAPGAAGPPPG